MAPVLVTDVNWKLAVMAPVLATTLTMDVAWRLAAMALVPVTDAN